MKIYILVFALMASFIATAQLPVVSSGRIVRHFGFPSQFVSARNVDVWLPDSYN